MWVAGTLLNGAEDIINPTFRTIHFEDGPPQVTVVIMARNAWTAKVPEDSESSGMKAVLGNWMRTHGNEETQWGAPEHVEQNPDKEDVGSAWRKEILHLCKSCGFVEMGINDAQITTSSMTLEISYLA